MRRIIATLLIFGVSLSSLPLRADYPQNMFVEEDNAPADEGCEVTPGLREKSGQPKESQVEMTAEPQGEELPPPADFVDQGDYTDQESYVTPEANEQEGKTQRKRWQNIGLAIGAIIVAVTAMLLVDSNDGHSKKHTHSSS